MLPRFLRSAVAASTRSASAWPRMGLVAGGALTAVGAFALSADVAQSAPAAAAGGAVPYWGKPGTPQERSFVALKPDAVQRGLIGPIIARFEAKGYKLVALKMVTPTKKMAEEHYGDLSTKPFFPGLVNFFSSGPIIAMVWEGQGVILGTRKMLGTTNPVDSAPGSIRGDYCIVTGKNIIHASDGPNSAEDEIKHWFTEAETNNWVSIAAAWLYEKQ